MSGLSPLALLLGITTEEDETALWENVWKELRWDLEKTQHVQNVFIHYARAEKYDSKKSVEGKKMENKKKFHTINGNFVSSDEHCYPLFSTWNSEDPSECHQLLRSMSITSTLDKKVQHRLHQNYTLNSFDFFFSGTNDNFPKFVMKCDTLERFFVQYSVPMGNNAKLESTGQRGLCPLSVAFTSSAVIDCRQFLRLCALLNVGTLHDVFRPLGKLRLALIFRRYDSGAKGYLNQLDLNRMICDIQSLGETWCTKGEECIPSTFLSLDEIISKIRQPQVRSNRINSLTSSAKFSIPCPPLDLERLDFNLFTQAVDSKLIQGTSRLLRVVLFYTKTSLKQQEKDMQFNLTHTIHNQLLQEAIFKEKAKVNRNEGDADLLAKAVNFKEQCNNISRSNWDNFVSNQSRTTTGHYHCYNTGTSNSECLFDYTKLDWLKKNSNRNRTTSQTFVLQNGSDDLIVMRHGPISNVTSSKDVPLQETPIQPAAVNRSFCSDRELPCIPSLNFSEVYKSFPHSISRSTVPSTQPVSRYRLSDTTYIPHVSSFGSELMTDNSLVPLSYELLYEANTNGNTLDFDSHGELNLVVPELGQFNSGHSTRSNVTLNEHNTKWNNFWTPVKLEIPGYVNTPSYFSMFLFSSPEKSNLPSCKPLHYIQKPMTCVSRTTGTNDTVCQTAYSWPRRFMVPSISNSTITQCYYPSRFVPLLKPAKTIIDVSGTSPLIREQREAAPLPHAAPPLLRAPPLSSLSAEFEEEKIKKKKNFEEKEGITNCQVIFRSVSSTHHIRSQSLLYNSQQEADEVDNYSAHIRRDTAEQQNARSAVESIAKRNDLNPDVVVSELNCGCFATNVEEENIGHESVAKGLDNTTTKDCGDSKERRKNGGTGSEKEDTCFQNNGSVIISEIRDALWQHKNFSKCLPSAQDIRDDWDYFLAIHRSWIESLPKPDDSTAEDLTCCIEYSISSLRQLYIDFREHKIPSRRGLSETPTLCDLLEQLADYVSNIICENELSHSLRYKPGYCQHVREGVRMILWHDIIVSIAKETKVLEEGNPNRTGTRLQASNNHGIHLCEDSELVTKHLNDYTSSICQQLLASLFPIHFNHSTGCPSATANTAQTPTISDLSNSTIVTRANAELQHSRTPDFVQAPQLVSTSHVSVTSSQSSNLCMSHRPISLNSTSSSQLDEDSLITPTGKQRLFNCFCALFQTSLEQIQLKKKLMDIQLKCTRRTDVD